MKTNIKRAIFLILIIINCTLIFYFSNQVADNSSKQSSRVVEFVSNVIPIIKNMKEPDKGLLKSNVLIPIVRKMAHFSIYTTLGIWSINFINTFKKLSTSKKILIAIIFCMLYAISDEIHQTYIVGRSGEIRDVLIDTLGSITGILLTKIQFKNINKIGKETE